MSKRLVWDQDGDKLFETGVDRGVIYPYEENAYGKGVPWNGLTSVEESPSGAEPTTLWANNGKYLNLISREEYAATIGAYTYPDEFAECDGSAELIQGVQGVRVGQQARKMFGFCYRSQIGNDTLGEDYGYKLHIIYGCKAKPSTKTHSTVNDSPEAAELSWELSTTPIDMPNGLKPSATIEIDSTKFKTEDEKARLAKLEDFLYGSDGDQPNDPTFPTPEKVLEILGGTQTQTQNQNGSGNEPQDPNNGDNKPQG